MQEGLRLRRADAFHRGTHPPDSDNTPDVVFFVEGKSALRCNAASDANRTSKLFTDAGYNAIDCVVFKTFAHIIHEPQCTTPHASRIGNASVNMSSMCR